MVGVTGIEPVTPTMSTTTVDQKRLVTRPTLNASPDASDVSFSAFHGQSLGENAKVKTAALWLASHRSECTGALIPFIRGRFPLSMLEAIEAVKLGNALARGDRHE